MRERSLFVVLTAAVVGLPLAGFAQGFGRSPQAPVYTPPGYAAPAAAVPPGSAAAGYGGYPGAPMTGIDSAALTSDPNRKLQQNDALSLRIEEDREPAMPLVVSPAGEVVVEPLPYPVKIAGLTVADAAATIKRQLDRDYYQNATVRLTLDRATQTAAGTIMLSGQVQQVGPLPVYADRPLTVTGAVLARGGFKLYADDRRVRVTRPVGGGKAEIFTVDCKKVLQEGRIELDRQVRDGDQIFVPEVWVKH